jgi:putative nucleotidyltransferase with HDIG domain
MKNSPSRSDIRGLFANHNPDEVWPKVADIVEHLNPGFDFTVIQAVFNDVMRMFSGEYPGYCAIKTLYHDLPHTLDVFLCAARLAHGISLSGNPLADDETTLILIAALMHDIGYAQRHDEATGTGAQYTKNHVKRGVEFMRAYVTENYLPLSWIPTLELMMLSTDHMADFAAIPFANDRERLLGQMVATADLVGQMSDRTYLEKLLFLYQEFEEAQLGNYQGMLDLLRNTKNFYEVTRIKKLDGELESLYRKLTFYFKEWFGSERNYYLESLERNMAYLTQASQLDEAGCLSMLKRGGIVEKSRNQGPVRGGEIS